MNSSGTTNIRQVLTRRCAALGIPVSGTFELTPRCNLQCKMCYIRLTPTQMASIGRERTAAEWIRLAQSARDAGMLFLLITGGEPTLRPDFPEIYEQLAQMGLSISINTNGTLLTPQLQQLWHRLPPAQVCITLYGLSGADYGQLCGDPTAFDRVIAAIDWLRQENILVQLNATMTPHNQNMLPDLETFAKARDLELRVTSYCFPPVRREECSPCEGFSRLPPEEAAFRAVQDLYLRTGQAGLRKQLEDNIPPTQEDCIRTEGEGISCLAGRAQFWITWDGRMTPCGMLTEPAASPFGQDFASQWEQLRQSCAQIRLCPECAACAHKHTCFNCAAVIHAETGRFDGKPEYMCRFNEAYRRILAEASKKV